MKLKNIIKKKTKTIFNKMVCDGFYGRKKEMSFLYKSACMVAIYSMHFREKSQIEKMNRYSFSKTHLFFSSLFPSSGTSG